MLGDLEKSQEIEVLKNLSIVFSFSSYFQSNWLNSKTNHVCKESLKNYFFLVFLTLKFCKLSSPICSLCWHCSSGCSVGNISGTRQFLIVLVLNAMHISKIY